MTGLTEEHRHQLQAEIAERLDKLIFDDPEHASEYPVEGVDTWVHITRAAMLERYFSVAIEAIGKIAYLIVSIEDDS